MAVPSVGADAGIGIAPASQQVAPGEAKYQALIDGGFNQNAADAWKQQQTAHLVAAGFKPDEVDHYWGDGPRAGHIAQEMASNNTARWTVTPAPAPEEAHGLLGSLAAGWDQSIVGMQSHLMARNVHIWLHGADAGGTPDLPLVNTAPAKNPTVLDSIAQGVGQTVGDAPYLLAALVAAPGGNVAKGTAAGGGTQVLRNALIASYNYRNPNGPAPIQTWRQFADATTHGVLGAAAVGGLSAGAGGVAGEGVNAVGGTALASHAANAAVMTATATGLAGAMDGKMPDARDFTSAAILAIGFNVATHGMSGGQPKLSDGGQRVVHNLQDIYVKTGITPQDALALAESNPSLHQEIIAQDVNGDTVHPGLRAYAPPEPKGYEPPTPEPGVSAPAGPRTHLPAPVAGSVDDAMRILARIEGGLNPNGTARVSPAGAIGEFQIMPGTARQYGFDPARLYDKTYNEQAGRAIVTALMQHYHGDMNAIAIAYNAGPGRANAYLRAGPGTAMEAIPDKAMRGGIRYESVPSVRDESHLPMETQHYIANARRVGKLPQGEGAEAGVPALVEHNGTPSAPGADLSAVEAEEKTTGTGSGADLSSASTWREASDQDLTDEILSNVGEQRKPGAWAGGINRFLSEWVSELTPARRIDDRLVQEGLYKRNESMGFEDQFRQTYASDSRASAFVRYGAVDPVTKEVIPDTATFKDAARAMKEDGGDVDGWKAYMLAKRTVEKGTPRPIIGPDGEPLRDKEGNIQLTKPIDTGFNQFASREVASRSSMVKKYKRATAIFQRVNDGFLDYMQGSGMVSAAQVEAMRSANETYVSMRRLRGDDAAFATDGKGRSFGLSQTLRKMEGSDRQIIDPFKATFDNLRVGVGMADKNMARLAVIDAAAADPRIATLIGLKKVGEVKADPNDDEIENLMRAYGVQEQDFEQFRTAYEPLLASRIEKDLSPNEFLAWQDGKATRYSVDDPMFAGLLRNSSSKQETNGILAITSGIARLERTGIISLPDFPARVGIWHQFNQWIMDPLHPTPLLTFMRGLPHVISGDTVFQNALSRGAMGSALVDMGQDWVKHDMEATFTQGGVWDHVWNMAKHPLELAELINTRIDAANRVGYTLAAEKAGISDPVKAATMARKGGIDYAERAAGGIANGLAKNVAFFRPRLLGLKQGWEAFADQGEGRGKAAFGVVSRALLGITMPVIAMYAANYMADKNLPEGQRWGDLPQWERDTMLITPPIGGVRLKLRLPANFGLPFGGAVNRMLDGAVGDADTKAHALDQWFSAILREYVPSPLPQFAQTPLEVMANHSFSTGRPLISDSLRERSPDLQYTENTTAPAIALAGVIGKVAPVLHLGDGVSPIQVEHMVEGWGGPLAMDAMRTLNAPFDHTGRPFDPANVPVIRGFVVRNPGMSSAHIENFYSQYNEFTQQKGDYSFLRKAAMAAGQTDVDTSRFDQDMAQAATHLEGVSKALGQMRQVVQGIEQNDHMNGTEKRQAIENVYQQAVVMASYGSAMMDAVRQNRDPDQRADVMSEVGDRFNARLQELQDQAPPIPDNSK